MVNLLRWDNGNTFSLSTQQRLVNVCYIFVLLNDGDFVLGFMYQPLSVRVGILYCLYLLCSTQLLRPRELIKVSMGKFASYAPFRSNHHYLYLQVTWQEILLLYREIKQNKLVDAYHIFRKMHKEG